MAMDTTIVIASALSGVNIALLAVLTGVWLRNYRTFRSPLILSLVLFSVILLAENAVAIYFFFSTSMLYSSDPVAQQAVVVLRALQLCALAALTYATTR